MDIGVVIKNIEKKLVWRSSCWWLENLPHTVSFHRY